MIASTGTSNLKQAMPWAWSVTVLLFVACGGGADKPTNALPPDTASTTAPLDGRTVKQLPDGGRIEGNMVNGKRDGTWFSYFKHGGPRSRITYVDGLEEGQTEVFHESGLTYYVGQYHRGRNAGTWIFYDEQGNEVNRAVYDSLGVLVRQDRR
jgi:hypothetical protein